MVKLLVEILKVYFCENLKMNVVKDSAIGSESRIAFNRMTTILGALIGFVYFLCHYAPISYETQEKAGSIDPTHTKNRSSREKVGSTFLEFTHLHLNSVPIKIPRSIKLNALTCPQLTRQVASVSCQVRH